MGMAPIEAAPPEDAQPVGQLALGVDGISGKGRDALKSDADCVRMCDHRVGLEGAVVGGEESADLAWGDREPPSRVPPMASTPILRRVGGERSGTA
jgi:hypothetical protein